MFVEDAAKKKAIADVYLANARGYLSGPAPEYPDGDTRGERMGRVRDSATYLAEHMHRAPVLLIPCLKGREDESAVGGVSFWASLFPAVWSFCLALRSRGLGSCWTTLHLLDNGEHKVADVLGIPYDEYSQGGLLPIAYTQGIDFRPAKRLPAESVTHWNGWELAGVAVGAATAVKRVPAEAVAAWPAVCAVSVTGAGAACVAAAGGAMGAPGTAGTAATAIAGVGVLAGQ
ncbi:oxidoreductase [Mycobacterium tuberculosis]|nr:oxidoreductase [Mycobacterium tuberculosis]